MCEIGDLNTYTVTEISCYNCGSFFKEHIFNIGEKINEAVCPKCGCRSLDKGYFSKVKEEKGT